MDGQSECERGVSVLLSRKKDVNMLSGPIVKALLAIALPIMVMNVMQSLFNIIDMTVLKSYESDITVGAVGTCSTLISTITGLMIGISSGANVVVSKYIGAGDKERVERAIGTAILVAVTGGLLLTVVGVTCAEVFLGWMNCPDALLKDAALYFRLYFVGVPILMLYNFCAAILRSTGDSKRPMLFLMLGGALKVIFTFVFVAFCHMGVSGVAVATIISWSTSCALGFITLVKNNSVAKINFKKLHFYAVELRETLRIGVPAGMQQALYSVANVIIASTVNTYGEYATTGISIANSFDSILYQIVVAPSLALMSYVSQNIGNKNVKRARQAIVRGILLTVGIGATFGALSAIFSGPLSSIMTDNPEIVRYSQQKMMLISSTYFICGINEIMGAALRGMGRPMVAMVSTLIFMCAIRFVWVYLIFTPLRDSLANPLTFLYLIWPLGWTLSIGMQLCFFFPTIKKLKKKFSQEQTQAA